MNDINDFDYEFGDSKFDEFCKKHTSLRIIQELKAVRIILLKRIRKMAKAILLLQRILFKEEFINQIDDEKNLVYMMDTRNSKPRE